MKYVLKANNEVKEVLLTCDLLKLLLNLPFTLVVVSECLMYGIITIEKKKNNN